MEELEYFSLNEGKIEKNIVKLDFDINNIDIHNEKIINYIIKDYTIFINSFKNKCKLFHIINFNKTCDYEKENLEEFFKIIFKDKFFNILEDKNEYIREKV